MKMQSVVFLTMVLGSVAKADSVYDYLNGAAFKAGAQSAYTAAMATDVLRNKIIVTAQEECGGRYEGTEIMITELSHHIEANKDVERTRDPKVYFLKFDSSSEDQWLVVETIKCSFHGGHYRSVLSARLVGGLEKMIIRYKYVNDNQVGGAVVSGVSRTYSMGAKQLEGEYKTPYGTIVTP